MDIVPFKERKSIARDVGNHYWRSKREYSAFTSPNKTIISPLLKEWLDICRIIQKKINLIILDSMFINKSLKEFYKKIELLNEWMDVPLILFYFF